MLATAILGFALSGLLALFANASVLNTTNRNAVIAAEHAQYILESIRNTAFANVATGITGGTWNRTATSLIADNMTPLPSEVITTTASGSDPLQVTVTVSWYDRGQRSRSLQLQTMFTNYQ